MCRCHRLPSAPPMTSVCKAGQAAEGGMIACSSGLLSNLATFPVGIFYPPSGQSCGEPGFFSSKEKTRVRGREIPPTREWGGGGRSLEGEGEPHPTSGFMMSDSARAFPSLGQRTIERRAGLDAWVLEKRGAWCLDSGGGHRDPGIMCHSLQYHPPQPLGATHTCCPGSQLRPGCGLRLTLGKEVQTGVCPTESIGHACLRAASSDPPIGGRQVE